MSMTTLNEKTIKLSKLKSVLLFLGSFGFVAAGITMVIFAQSISDASQGADDPVFIQAMGLAAVAFFGLTGFVSAKILVTKKPGLILNAQGITDQSSGLSAGFIPWSDVTQIGENKVKGQKFATIFVVDPMIYIERGNRLAQAAKNTNLKISGTPINISANTLKLSHDELMQLLQEFFVSYGAETAGQD